MVLDVHSSLPIEHTRFISIIILSPVAGTVTYFCRVHSSGESAVIKVVHVPVINTPDVERCSKILRHSQFTKFWKFRDRDDGFVSIPSDFQKIVKIRKKYC